MTPIGTTGPEAGKGRELLSVQVAGQDFALDIMAVREIRGWVASTPLPHAPGYIKGMINLRGVVMAIVGLADRLGLPSDGPTKASVVVVVEVAGRTVGLLVDAVNDIITVTDAMLQATPETGDGAAKSFVEGLLTMDTRIVGIVALSAVIADAGELQASAAA